jgi:hypothetical protein
LPAGGITALATIQLPQYIRFYRLDRHVSQPSSTSRLVDMLKRHEGLVPHNHLKISDKNGDVQESLRYVFLKARPSGNVDDHRTACLYEMAMESPRGFARHSSVIIQPIDRNDFVQTVLLLDRLGYQRSYKNIRDKRHQSSRPPPPAEPGSVVAALSELRQDESYKTPDTYDCIGGKLFRPWLDEIVADSGDGIHMEAFRR